MKALELYDSIMKHRTENEGKYPDHGFINIKDHQSLFNDRDIFDYSRRSLTFEPETSDFDFMGIPFYICNNVNAPLTLVSK